MEVDKERYDQTASDFQVPCFIMCSSGTPSWKAHLALQKSLNVRGVVRFNNLEIFFKCFLATESVRLNGIF